MTTLKVYLQLYATSLRDALAAIRRNAWTVVIPVALLFARAWLGAVALPLGFVGRILALLATAALSSSYLYFVGELSLGRHVSTREVKASFGAHLWPIANVYFVVWIASLVLELSLGRNPDASGAVYALWLIAFIAFNATPEVIYVRGTHGGLQTLTASWDFLKAQWIPWLAVTVPLLALLSLVAIQLRVALVAEVLTGALLHVFMVFRGALFRALDGTSHRQRMFAQRVA